MPGANTRAMEKARGIDCDSIIFDLEDAVAPDSKLEARDYVSAAIAQGGYGHRELIVRCNGLDTPWGEADARRFASQPGVDGLLFPKVETLEQVAAIHGVFSVAGTDGADVAVWVMIETPLGVLNVEALARSAHVNVLVMGTSDLVNALRGRHSEDRSGLSYALQRCVLAARAAGAVILDGVHLDFRNAESLEVVCEQGRNFGFDGKTLIHPLQVEIANRVFGPSADDVDFARRVVDAWREATEQGKGVAVVDGQLVENLHVEAARRTIAFADAIDARH